MTSVEILVRPATLADRDAMGALKLRASLAWGELVEELRDLPDAREVAIELIASAFVAETEGRIVGFATVIPNDEGHAELEDIFVEPADWRRGVGRQLMAEAMRRARALGASRLQVVANENALAFYEASGFQTIGQVMTLLKPARRMELRLEGAS